MKQLKDKLKVWNKSVFGSIKENIQCLKKKIHELDIVDNVFGLKESEIAERRSATADLLKNLSWKHGLAVQKARITWAKEGDANTQFFHKAINQRRKVNEIVGIQCEAGWVEEVEEVKSRVREYFQSHFKKQDMKRPRWNQNFESKKLTAVENSMLCEPFSE